MLSRLAVQLRRSFAKRGAIGTLREACVTARECLRGMTPSVRAARLLRQREQQDFDIEWNTQTGGCVVPEVSDVVGASYFQGLRYEAIHPSSLLRLIGNLNVPYDEYVFVDLGAGKGRALLLASQYPFKKIIGVEYSVTLSQAARANVMTAPRSRMRCTAIDVVTLDASKFLFPPSNIALFLYNPFGADVMRAMCDNLRHSLAISGASAVVIYVNPEFRSVLDSASFLRNVVDDGYAAVYQSCDIGLSPKTPQ